MMWNRTSGGDGPRIAAEKLGRALLFATLVTVMIQVVLILSDIKFGRLIELGK